MPENRWLAEQFDGQRNRLRAVAYRMLGSHAEADDAVQETWLRLSGSDADAIENLAGWLTTVVGRVCLDMLRSRKSRREETIAAPEAEQPGQPYHAAHPDADILLADAVGPALLVVLETLEPAERVAFVLHDMFDLTFSEIAPIVGRSEAATRQLASRARRRVRGGAGVPDADSTRRREVVKAFLAASREGDFGALLGLLDPDVVLRADNVAVEAAAANQGRGAPRLLSEVRGAHLVAEAFKGRAVGARLALIDGAPGAVWAAPDGKPRAVFAFTIRSERVIEINLVMEPARVDELDIEIGVG
jgi:RNA polymerase sigma-70 factor (ECF subfamily)